METEVTLMSDGLELWGSPRRLDDLAEGDPQPTVIAVRGVGGTRRDNSLSRDCSRFCDYGNTALPLEMHRCGECGRNIPMDQVQDLDNVFTRLQDHPGVDPDRIVLLGDSPGNAVSPYAGDSKLHMAGILPVGGWSDGVEKIKLRHAGPGAYANELGMLELPDNYKAETGASPMASRFDIVAIPTHLPGGVATDSITESPVETVAAIHSFGPIDVLAHSRDDHRYCMRHTPGSHQHRRALRCSDMPSCQRT